MEGDIWRGKVLVSLSFSKIRTEQSTMILTETEIYFCLSF